MSLYSLSKAACLGATAMYFLDPERGADRRAMIREKCNAFTDQLTAGMTAAQHDAGQRLQQIQSDPKSIADTLTGTGETWSPAAKFMAGVAGATFFLTGSLKAACLASGVSGLGLGMSGSGEMANLSQTEESRRRRVGSSTRRSQSSLGTKNSDGVEISEAAAT